MTSLSQLMECCLEGRVQIIYKLCLLSNCGHSQMLIFVNFFVGTWKYDLFIHWYCGCFWFLVYFIQCDMCKYCVYSALCLCCWCLLIQWCNGYCLFPESSEQWPFCGCWLTDRHFFSVHRLLVLVSMYRFCGPLDTQVHRFVHFSPCSFSAWNSKCSCERIFSPLEEYWYGIKAYRKVQFYSIFLCPHVCVPPLIVKSQLLLHLHFTWLVCQSAHVPPHTRDISSSNLNDSVDMWTQHSYLDVGRKFALNCQCCFSNRLESSRSTRPEDCCL